MAGCTGPPPGDEAAAVLAARSAFVTWFMTAYFRRYTKRHFHAVRVARAGLPVLDPGAGVIVYANHPSWWDPVMFMLLQAHVFPGRAGYGPMDAEALERYGVLRRIGIFGLETGSRRAAVRFLRVGDGILRRPGTVLWVTAEGGFTDPRQRPLRLQTGVAHLLRNHPGAVAVPLAMEFPFWNESTPEALARFGEPLTADADRDVAAWDSLLTERLSATMDRLAEDAMARDPGRFHSVVAGKAGIGGIYDVWRGAQAMLRGQRPHLEHEHPAHEPQGHRPLGHRPLGHRPLGSDLAGHPQPGRPAP